MGRINHIDNSCKKEHKNKIIILKENKKGSCNSTYEMENKNKEPITIIDIENCIYKNNNISKRCDWGIETRGTVYFIELKGIDFDKGFQQLYETIIDMESCFKGKQIKARLVVSRVSSIDILKKDLFYKKLSKKIFYIPLKNDHIIYKSNNIKETI